jgi:CPA2 family monovalent cation:H+ antiporter-2
VLQDIVGVAVASFILVLYGNDQRSLVQAIGGLIGFGITAYISARLLPSLLRRVRTAPDLFLIYSVAIGLVLAAVGATVFGIPMALAAFVAGLAIRTGEDTDEVRRVLLPFRDLFAVLFFVLIGSLIQPSLIDKSLPFALLLVGLMVVVKTLPTYLIVKFTDIKSRPTQHAVGLSQLGEFSFVLGSAALTAGAISSDQFSGVLIAVVISIVASSVLVRFVGEHQAHRSQADRKPRHDAREFGQRTLLRAPRSEIFRRWKNPARPSGRLRAAQGDGRGGG